MASEISAATYYYVGKVDASTVEIPILALNPSERLVRGWESNSVKNYQGLSDMVGGASANERLTIAIPRFYAPFFFPKINKWEKLIIWASSKKKEGSYGQIEYTLYFKNIEPLSSLGIHQWQGLPGLAECFRNHFERILSRNELYKPIAVTLAVDPDANIYKG